MTGSTSRPPFVLPDGMSLVDVVREDLATHDGDVHRAGFRALVMYRVGVWRHSVEVPGVKRLLALVYRRWHRRVRDHYGIELHHTAVVGRRVRISHGGGVVVHRHARIGDDVLIRHGVTIGGGVVYSEQDGPVVHDGVRFGVGSVVAGDVTLGAGSRIGPNAVVTTDVDENSLVISPRSRTMPAPPS